MKHRWLVPLLLLSLGLNIGFLVMRFAPPHGPPPPPARDQRDVLRGHLFRMTEDLALSEEQQNELQVLYDRVFPDIIERSSRVQQRRQELSTVYAAPRLDPEELKGLLGRLNTAHGDLDALLAETIQQEASILSAEQRRRYVELMPWRQSREGAEPPPGGPGRRGGKPPPPRRNP